MRNGGRGRPLNWVVSHHGARVRHLAAAITLGIWSSLSAHGAESIYDCEVRHVYALSDKAQVESYWMETNHKGKRFSVSRKTGQIQGDLAATHSAQNVRVVHPGNEHYSFTAIAESGTHIQLISVNEFQ